MRGLAGSRAAKIRIIIDNTNFLARKNILFTYNKMVVKSIETLLPTLSKEQRKIIESSSYANLTENSVNIINCALLLALENIHEATNYTESCGGGGSPSSGWRREIRMMMTKDG